MEAAKKVRRNLQLLRKELFGGNPNRPVKDEPRKFIKCSRCGFESKDTRKFRSTILKEEKARILCNDCYKFLYGD